MEADALIGLGLLDEAEKTLTELEAAILPSGLASANLVLARCRGNLAMAPRFLQAMTRASTGRSRRRILPRR